MKLKKENYEIEKGKLENSIYFALKDDYLTNIFKDLLWGIIRYLEKKEDDSLKNFGEFIEHSHEYLFDRLNPLLKYPIFFEKWKRNDKNFIENLKNQIFPELKIENTSLLTITRETFEDRNIYVHTIIPEQIKPIYQISIPIVIIDCIKLFLLVENINFLLKKSRINKKQPINIEKKFTNIFKNSNKKIIDIFLNKVFKTNNKDKIFERKIITSENIENYVILQKYYPYYYFEDWAIESLLDSKSPFLFRSDGPYIIDFEKGNWIYIPKIAINIYNVLFQCKKSVIIKGVSGTGKTIISRYIGYTFYKQNFKVYYIDCIDHSKINIENTIIRLSRIYSVLNKEENILFIFENIHILDNESLNRINKIRKKVLCLCTQRVFDVNKEGEDLLSFEKNQIFNLKIESISFKETISGIIELNQNLMPIIQPIKAIGAQNLWIYGILLKIICKYQDNNSNLSIFEILKNNKIIGAELTNYFKNFVQKEQIHSKSVQIHRYVNHIKYFLAILSIFSEYELWTEEEFINMIISIRDETPLGQLNKKVNISENIITEIETYLLNRYEIRKNEIRTAFSLVEFKIPHTQLAIIYKNCILKLFEELYPGFIEQITYLYISYGKYYGSFLNQKYLTLIRKGEFKDYREINRQFFNFKSYLGSINYNNNIKVLQNQIINNSIEENNLFFHSINMYDNSLEIEIFEKIFQNEEILFDPIWKFKIVESRSPRLLFLLTRFKKLFGESLFIEFILKFKEEIIKKFEDDDSTYIIKFIHLLLKIDVRNWSTIYESIIKLLDKVSIEVEDFQSFYFSNHRIFNKIDKKYVFYTPIQKIFEKLIQNTSLERDNLIIPSIYDDRLKMFSQFYIEIIDKMLKQNSQSKQALVNLFERKLQDSSLFMVINFIECLYENNSKLALSFFTKFMNIIKNKLYTTDVADLEDFFGTLANFLKDEKDFIESAFLSDWDWFKGIFSRLTTGEFFYFSKFRIITHFFEELFPDYLQRYKEFYISLGKSRIKEFYEGLDCKIDIYSKLSNILEDELNIFILDLFNESIYESLKTNNLDFYIKYFTKFNSPFGFSILRDKWDFKKFITTNRFEEILSAAEDNELKEFFNIFWKGDSWKELLFEKYNDFLIKRFGENFKKILKVNEEQIQYLENLKNHIKKIEIVEIIKIYNHYSDPLFPHKKAYEFVHFRKFLEEKQDILLSHKFELKLNLLEFTEILNFLAILKIYHPNIVKNFYEKYNEIIYQKSRDNHSDVIEILTILEFYKLDIGSLKELDGYINEEFSLFQMILEWLTKIDLCTLRYIFQINPADFLKNYTNINISNHLKHSSLLQLSIFLYKEELKVAQKNPGYTYLRKMSFMGGPIQKFPFVLELSDKDFINIKNKFEPILILDFYYWNYKKDRITFLRHNNLLIKLISNQFIPFTNDITELIRKSEICLIALYLKSLTKILDDLEKNRLKIPENLAKYYISEDFKNKIKNAEFYDIYRLFKYLKMINFGLSREIWNRNKLYFEDVDFSIKLKNEYLYRIFKFYDIFNDTHFKFSLESIEILKNVMRLKPLETIIPYFLEILSNDDFNKLISTFKEELNNIAKNYSKFELKNMLSKHFMRKYNQDSLSMMNVIFKERLNEKYFFES